jgi:hypothetical protein
VVSGLTVMPALNGVYELDLSSGAYKQRRANKFLFRLPAPINYWMLGDTVGVNNGWLHSVVDGATPLGLNWKEFDLKTREWTQKSEITVSMSVEKVVLTPIDLY